MSMGQGILFPRVNILYIHPILLGLDRFGLITFRDLVSDSYSTSISRGVHHLPSSWAPYPFSSILGYLMMKKKGLILSFGYLHKEGALLSVKFMKTWWLGATKLVTIIILCLRKEGSILSFDAFVRKDHPYKKSMTTWWLGKLS